MGKATKALKRFSPLIFCLAAALFFCAIILFFNKKTFSHPDENPFGKGTHFNISDMETETPEEIAKRRKMNELINNEGWNQIKSIDYFY